MKNLKKKHRTESLISKRINTLKNVRNVFNKYQKDPNLSNSSFHSLLLSLNDEDTPEKNKECEKHLTRNGFKKSGLSNGKNSFLTKNNDKLYKYRPVLIKYMPKPKINVTKYSTINQIKVD